MTRNLLLRILTGVPLAVLVVLYIYAAGEIVFILITLIVIMVCTGEIAQALRQYKTPIFTPFFYLIPFLCYLAFWSSRERMIHLAVGLLMLSGALAISGRLRPGKTDSRLILWYFLPVAWIVCPFSLLVILRFDVSPTNGSHLILFVIAIAAFNDIAAYFGGKRWGRHRLAPAISPKKTIEGSLFGLAGGLSAGFGVQLLLMPEFLTPFRMIPLILCLTIASQIGDLLESKFKRTCRIKDSSNLIPGHGGLLDRIDAYLFAVPVFVGLTYLFGLQGG